MSSTGNEKRDAFDRYVIAELADIAMQVGGIAGDLERGLKQLGNDIEAIGRLVTAHRGSPGQETGDQELVADLESAHAGSASSFVEALVLLQFEDRVLQQLTLLTETITSVADDPALLDDPARIAAGMNMEAPRKRLLDALGAAEQVPQDAPGGNDEKAAIELF